MEDFLVAYWGMLALGGGLVGAGIALGMFHASTLRTGRRAHKENVKDLQELQEMLRENSINRRNRRMEASWRQSLAQTGRAIEKYGTPLRPEKR